MYAQKLEGDEWLGETLDKAKMDKMSGMLYPFEGSLCAENGRLTQHRSANRTTIRTHAGDEEDG